jgi:RNA polymerase sigma factor (sigma-70 family)
MALKPLALFIQRLRGLADAQTGGLTDAELLERFATRRDEAAFEVLLWRYGLLVLSVGRRMLRHEQDIEDVFQATFLTLVRKAGSISRRESLAGWLHKVAYRIALRARMTAARRGIQEPSRIDTLPARPAGENAELLALVDEEVNQLPARYRTAFVLCYLQGKTNAEAAQQLGCPMGTIASRLAWARERLRQRLTRRGVALSAGTFAGLVVQNETHAALPTALVHKTMRAALAFAAGKSAAAGLVSAHITAWTEGVIRAMFVSKVKMTAAVLLAFGLLGTGVGVVAQRVGAKEQPGGEERDGTTAAPAEAAPQTRPERDREAEVQKEAQLAEGAHKARAELLKADDEYLRLEEHWAERMAKARMELEHLEDKRNQHAEDMNLQLGEPLEEFRNARSAVRELTGIIERTANDVDKKALNSRLASAKAKLEYAQKRYEDLRQSFTERVSRAPIIAAEERLRSLERRQAFELDRARARVDAAEERLRQLEGVERQADFGSVNRRLRELERKVDALNRSLSDLRKELRRQPQKEL